MGHPTEGQGLAERGPSPIKSIKGAATETLVSQLLPKHIADKAIPRLLGPSSDTHGVPTAQNSITRGPPR